MCCKLCSYGSQLELLDAAGQAFWLKIKISWWKEKQRGLEGGRNISEGFSCHRAYIVSVGEREGNLYKVVNIFSTVIHVSSLTLSSEVPKNEGMEAVYSHCNSANFSEKNSDSILIVWYSYNQVLLGKSEHWLKNSSTNWKNYKNIWPETKALGFCRVHLPTNGLILIYKHALKFTLKYT